MCASIVLDVLFYLAISVRYGLLILNLLIFVLLIISAVLLVIALGLV